MRIVGSCILLFLTGCVSANETFTADGRKGHVISCPSGTGLVGQMTNWGTCFQKAGEICAAKGYTVLARSDEPGFAASANKYGASVGTTTNRMMIIQCNEAQQPVAAPPAPPRPK